MNGFFFTVRIKKAWTLFDLTLTWSNRKKNSQETQIFTLFLPKSFLKIAILINTGENRPFLAKDNLSFNQSFNLSFNQSARAFVIRRVSTLHAKHCIWGTRARWFESGLMLKVFSCFYSNFTANILWSLTLVQVKTELIKHQKLFQKNMNWIKVTKAEIWVSIEAQWSFSQLGPGLSWNQQNRVNPGLAQSYFDLVDADLSCNWREIFFLRPGKPLDFNLN